MEKQDVGKIVTRRDVLKLAGTAAAFCTSFGFLHGGQKGTTVEHKVQGNVLLHKWQQAEFKFYKGNELLGASPFPMKVLKHLQSDESATVEIKLFRSGNILRNMGTIESKF
jgi:hypothetical protein